MKPIVLASASPRRADLLRQIGLEFDIAESGVPEDDVQEKDPARLAERLALSKARAVAATLKRGIVIGADTVVCVDGEMLGKPADEEESRQMLRLLSGRSHDVLTGVAIIEQPGLKTLCRVERTRVFFRPLSDEEIRSYITKAEVRDKAGSYGIQGMGGGLVSRIEGCYFNVVGLPLALTVEMLKEFGVKVY